MADHHHTVIGLFDRDSDGRKAWALDANFTKFKSFDDVKVSKNSKAYAILLPVPENNPELAKSDHHCVEFMFPLEALHKKEEGKGLLLKGIPVETRCGNTVIHKIAGTEVWQMIVQDGKKWFAEKVVPSLPDDDFAAFDQIFKLIEATLQAKEKEHSLQPTGTEPDLIDEEASEISSEVHIYPSFSIGDRVCHVKFGNGNISWIDGNKLTIDFDQAGQKRVLEGFVERA